MRRLAIALLIAAVAVAFIFFAERSDNLAAPNSPSFRKAVEATETSKVDQFAATESSLDAPPVDEPPLRMEPNIYNSIGLQLPPIVSPDWSDEMEARILNYTTLFPDVPLTNLEAQCQEKECVLLLTSDGVIDIFQFNFDRFAETNGFQDAVIWTTEYGRAVHFRR